MDDIGTTLTITGGIATILSLVFAGAALYIQHKRRSTRVIGGMAETHKGTSPGSLLPVSEQPVADAHPHIEIPEPIEEKPVEQPVTPLFKQYAPSGVRDTVVSSTEDQSYIWE